MWSEYKEIHYEPETGLTWFVDEPYDSRGSSLGWACEAYLETLKWDCLKKNLRVLIQGWISQQKSCSFGWVIIALFLWQRLRLENMCEFLRHRNTRRECLWNQYNNFEDVNLKDILIMRFHPWVRHLLASSSRNSSFTYLRNLCTCIMLLRWSASPLSEPSTSSNTPVSLDLTKLYAALPYSAS